MRDQANKGEELMCECCGTEKDIYLPQMATVGETKPMNETEIYLRLSMDDGELVYKPGQFVEVSIAGIGEAPISISSSPLAGWTPVTWPTRACARMPASCP